MNIRTVDLFSGCGGLSLGFQDAGFDVIQAFDNWQPAIEVYRANFNHPISDIDLSSEDAIEFIKSLKTNVIIGGPPCQDFSSAGKRDETLGRADLTLSYAKIISSLKPEWFLMENVERIIKSRILKDAIKIFRNAGYGLTMKVLDASYCGVPQARKRFFLIGHLHSKDEFLTPYLDRNLSKEPMSIYDYLGKSLGLEYYYRHPRSYMRRGIFSIYEPSPTVRGVNRPIPKGYKKHSGDPVDITDELRPLTTIERSYLQTFPKSFKFEGSKTNLEQMIGNAVPVKLAKYVGLALLEYMQDFENNRVYKQGQMQLNLFEQEVIYANNQ